MTFSKFATTASVLAILAGTASAQDYSGTASLSYGYVDGSNDVTFTETLLGGSVQLDFTTASGWYYGGEISHEEASNITGSDYYVSGTTAILHAGNAFGWGTGEVFAGYLSGTSGDGTAERYFAGISAGKAISSAFSINGQIGYLDGQDDSGGSSYEDMLSKAVFAGIGGTYTVNSALSVDLGISGAIGVMDQDKDRGDIAEVSVGLDYTVPNNPAWTLFSDASYTYYYQHGENDQEDVMQVSLGVSYSFGGASPRDVLGDTLPLAQWASIMEGVLE